MTASSDYEIQKPIIFFGSPRSGTTVISEIISRHPDLAWPSQYTTVFPKYPAVNLIRRLFNNKLWKIHGQKKQLNKVGIFNEMFFRASESYPMWRHLTKNQFDFSRDFLVNKTVDESTKNYIRNYFTKLVRYQGKKRLMFKITGPSKIEFILSIFPDALFIRINREPIPTISSLMKSSFWERLGAKKIWWTGVYSKLDMEWVKNHKANPVAMTAFQVKKIMDVADKEISTFNVPIIDISYLDFVKNPEQCIQKIIEFTQLSNDKTCFDYLKKNKIYNRNKKDEEYFNNEDLKIIYELFNKEKFNF